MSNNPIEETKRVLPNRKNRGAKMAQLESNLDQMLYDEEHQWLFLEESSDDDFDPNERGNYNESVKQEDEDDEDYEDEDDSSNKEENGGNEIKTKGIAKNNNNCSSKNNLNTKKPCFFRKRKREPVNKEIYDINQLNIDKIDNYEWRRDNKRKQKRLKAKQCTNMKVVKNGNSENKSSSIKELPKKKILFLIHPDNNKTN